ncbi:sodium:solute symporter [Siminovitchia sediminis]|uniref:Sodium:solute symporter n=1 Tax=Siminovitchia sediminis TaxID=1274353 RepID=A0ABW4KNP2_9BACI
MTVLFISMFLAMMLLINIKNLNVKNYDDYATANSSFGMIGIGLAVFSTWYVGASWTAWADFSVGSGFLGVYVIPYAAMMMFTMYLVSEKAFIWGKKYKVKTQAELIGLRYQSKLLRVLVAISGVVFVTPWLLIEWTTMGYVFSYGTGGVLSPFWGMLIGVVVVLVYVALGGMRSVIIGNIVQGVLMFFIGTFVMFWMIYEFFGSFSNAMNLLAENHPETLTFPGPTLSSMPTSFWTSLLVVNGLGAFMWPWAFNKLFAAKNVQAIKKSTLVAPIIGLIFWAAFTFLGQSLHLFEFGRNNPEEAYIWAASQAGSVHLALLSVVIMAAGLATVAGMIQAMSTAISTDIAQVINKNISERTALRIARTTVVLIGIGVLISAAFNNLSLNYYALLGYQGIVMLFPIVILGLYWKRANKEGAIIGLILGTAVAMLLQVINPGFIEAWGWTPGIYGAIIATISIVIFGLLKPAEEHVDLLWEDIEIVRNKKIKQRNTTQEKIAN